MTDMIIAYGAEGCQEFLLPDCGDSLFEICLEKEVSGAGREISVGLMRTETSWYFKGGKTYTLSMKDGSDGAGRMLEDGMTLRLRNAEGGQAYLLYAVCAENFSLFQKYRLGNERPIVIGSGNGAVISYGFQNYVSGEHAVLYRRKGCWKIRSMGNAGICLNEKKVPDETTVDFGDRISVFGLRIIWMTDFLTVCVRFGKCRVDEKLLPVFSGTERALCPKQERSRTPDGDEADFKRIPRKTGSLYTDPVEIEVPSAVPETAHRPALLTVGPGMTMALPMLLGCAMAAYGSGNRFYLISGAVTALASALVGTLWTVAALRYAAREAEEKEADLRNAYGSYLDRMEGFLQQKQEDNRQILFRDFPSGRECCGLDREDGRFWNRSREQEDFLHIRLGTGTIPFQAEIRVSGGGCAWNRNDMAECAYEMRERYRFLRHAPVCADLQRMELIGIVGGNGKKGAYGVARSIAAQIAANYCCTDVKMAFFYEEGPEASRIWSFARWLPHVWTEDGRYRMIAGNKIQTGEISYELAGIFRGREERKETEPTPHYIIFADSLKLLEGELLLHYIFHPEKSCGLTTILLAERYEDLPSACRCVVRNDGSVEKVLYMCGGQPERELHLELTGEAELELFSRRLCGIRVKDGSGGAVPDTVDFLEIYGGCTPEQLRIPDRWKTARSEESLRVPVGRKAGGRLCCVDIHEKYHGPHGLVAGMTGSGKSELLQTLVLSLAVSFSPEEVAFFMIDFKGGGTADLFENLPHMAGKVTNLSGSRIQRALLSIKSENLRRQRILAENGVNNINRYIRMYKEGRAGEPLPHLVIIVDEFAELKKQEPEFMAELISVAQVGRSLGIHLILATQKPAGTVDERIWSNARFRLCLRVQDRQDSRDMLGRPDAAYLLQAGRGYFQVGNDEVYEEFQTAYSGAGYRKEPERMGHAAVLIGLTGETLRMGRSRREPDVQGETQLQVLVRWIARQAEEQQCRDVRKLWLPPLPEKIFLKTILGEETHFPCEIGRKTETGKRRIALAGYYDDPANQEQGIYKIIFPDTGHLAVCGMAGTGKSTFLMTLLYSLALRYTPEQLQFYALDYSAGMLSTLEKAPHCGGVVTDTEEERTERFFYLLEKIMDERKCVQRDKDRKQEKQPVLLVALDHFSGFQDRTEGRFDKYLLRLLREGEAYGMFLLVSGNGFGNGGIPQGLGEYIRTVVCLEMSDRYKYVETMRTNRIPVLPEAGVRGRGIAYIEGRILEFQTAFPGGETEGSLEDMEEACECLEKSWYGACPEPIPFIPDRPTLAGLEEREEYRRMTAGKRFLPFGYFHKDASVCAFDLWKSCCWLIQGRDGTGKRNLLKVSMHAAARKEKAQLYLIDQKGSSLSAGARRLGATCLENRTQVCDFFQERMEDVQERSRKKQDMIAGGMDQETVMRKMEEEPQIFLFAADVAALLETAFNAPEGQRSAQVYLESIMESGCGLGIYFFGLLRPEDVSGMLGSRTFRKMAAYGTGIHLGGNAGDQRLFRFSDLSYAEQGSPSGPGRGLLPPGPADSVTRRVVLPLAESEEKGGIC